MGCEAFKTDQQFIDAIRSDGALREKATECLYRKYWSRVHRTIYGKIRARRGQTADTHDLIQDAFLIMIEKIRGDGYKQGVLVHFWIGIAKGLFRNKFKRDIRLDLHEDAKSMDQVVLANPEDLLITVQRNAILDDLLSKIGDRCKSVLRLWMLGYSMREIADKVDLSSEAMARKTKYQCKNKLIALFEDLDIDL